MKARGTQLLRGSKPGTVSTRAPSGTGQGLPYVTLHSLSHLLITQIALECGYPAASLRERVYAYQMSGCSGS